MTCKVAAVPCRGNFAYQGLVVSQMRPTPPAAAAFIKAHPLPSIEGLPPRIQLPSLLPRRHNFAGQLRTKLPIPCALHINVDI